MRKISCVILVLMMTMVLSGCKSTASLAEGKRVVGYYAQWVAAQRGYFVSSIPADKLTHINYAFANVTDDGKCILGDIAADTGRVFTAEESVNGKADSSDPTALHGNFNQLLQLKEKYPHIQTLISIGGWTWSENFSDAALTAPSIESLIKSGSFDSLGYRRSQVMAVLDRAMEQAKAADAENDVRQLLKTLQQLSRTQGDLSKRDRWAVDLACDPGLDDRVGEQLQQRLDLIRRRLGRWLRPERAGGEQGAGVGGGVVVGGDHEFGHLDLPYGPDSLEMLQ